MATRIVDERPLHMTAHNGPVFRREIAKRLPEPAADIYRELHDRRTAAFSLTRTATDQMHDVRAEFDRARRYFEQVEEAHARGHLVRTVVYRDNRGNAFRAEVEREINGAHGGGGIGGADVPLGDSGRREVVVPDASLLAAARTDLQDKADELARCQTDVAQKAEKSDAEGAVLINIDNYVGRIPRDLKIALHVPELLEPSPQPVPEEVAVLRGRISGFAALIDDIRAAPIRSSDAKASARRAIEELAGRGRPDVFGLLEPRNGGLRFAEQPVSIPLFTTAPGVGGFAGGEVLDALGLIAWLHRDALIAAVEREIDGGADDVHALSSDERSARLAAAAAERLSFEREEEYLIRALHRQGYDVTRRADADPRAVLGLADTMPAP